MSFEGKIAVVAGAGGGMGLNIANDLISAGAHVTLLDLKPRPDVIADGPGSAAYHQGDATDEAFVESVIGYETTRSTVVTRFPQFLHSRRRATLPPHRRRV